MSSVRKLSLGLMAAVLAVELTDELVDGVGRAALPLIRTQFHLGYAQVGLLLGVPGLVGSVVEPFLAVAADVRRRITIVLGGGVTFIVALAIVSTARNFPTLLAGFVLFYPASGAFVSLSQASLMDADPSRREHNMARWTVAGYAGNVAGPALVAAALAVGTGWRAAYGSVVAVALLALAGMARFPFAAPHPDTHPSVVKGLVDAAKHLRRGEVLRWLVLLELSDLMLDVFTGFLALYLVDVGRLKPAETAVVIGARSAAGLVGELGVVALLERVRGLRYLRWSVLVTIPLYAAFLAVPGVVVKIALAIALGTSTAGWYSILKAQLYAAMPGRSGSSIAIGNISGLIWSAVPIAIGAVAQTFGIRTAMWILALGPIALLAGIPARQTTRF